MASSLRMNTSEQVHSYMENLWKTYRRRAIFPYDCRREILINMRELIVDHQEEFVRALHADLNRSRVDAIILDINIVLHELDEAISNLRKWMSDEKLSTPIAVFPGTSIVRPTPKGVVAIFSPWNFPVNLPLCPLIGAIAAGNCAILRLSSMSRATSSLIRELFTSNLPTNVIRVIMGPHTLTETIFEHKVSHCFFTGSPRIGKVMLQHCAPQLTPVSLELGGKCPCWVDPSCALETSARRLAWGKFTNAGQICLAVDYVLTVPDFQETLVEQLVSCVSEFYGENAQESPEYCRIINEHHAKRIKTLVEDALLGGAVAHTPVCFNVSARYVSPIILTGVTPEMAIMQEEIFGPVLPILTVPDVDAAVEFINERPSPLSLYTFTGDSDIADYILDRTLSGSACVNDAVIQVNHMPFSAVGNSGMCRYHGKLTFDLFSHMRSIFKHGTWIEADKGMRYPNRTERGAYWLLKMV